MILSLVCWLLTAYWVILLLHVIFSWVPRPPEPLRPVVRGVRALVEPLAAPLRRAIPPLRMGNIGLDLSILVLFFGLYLVQRLICG